jgi:hypothetical protein
VLEVIGLVVAPTTLVTALAFYFGWVLTNSRMAYYGIAASALDFSVQDYLMRSADALFVPVSSMAVVALGAVWLHAYAIGQLTDGTRRARARLRIAARAAVIAGGVLFMFGAVSVFDPLSVSPYYLFPPASPGIGIGLLAYGLHLMARLDATDGVRIARTMDARSRVTMIALVALLIVLSSFWTASTYADALGRGRSMRYAATLHQRPEVTVFASKRLDINGDGAIERRLPGRDLAYHYRYSGLRLLLRSGGKYFLLPENWTRSRGTAIVLADSADYRFEFGSGL